MSYNRRRFIQTGLLGATVPLLPSSASAQQPALRYNFSWDRSAHIRLATGQLPRSRSCYFDMPPWTPRAANQEGVVSYFDSERLRSIRARVKGVDRNAYYRDILDHILKDAHTDRERVAAICQFVGDAIYFNPVQLPVERGPNAAGSGNDNLVALMDPVELLELHDGRCGQLVAVTQALLAPIGIEARKVQLDHHISCEAKYDGGWHLADALMFGGNQPHRGGAVVSGDEIRADPYVLDSFPVPNLVGTPDELLTADGFRCLGYAGGEWGSSLMPYASWYWRAPLDVPPTMPYPLVTQRLDGQRVRLNWAPSFKVGGGAIEYHIDIFAERDCKQRVHNAVTKVNYLEWEVPQKNTIYFIETRAKDDHRRFNPDTWYPATRNNFLLVPPEQYGWYGVV
jgi:hypothetical protein